MATCPAGHASAATDYCDECGASMGAARPAADAPSLCVVCGSELDARFCEACGHDQRRAAPVGVVWSMVATADREWFDEVRAREGPDVASVAFPQHYPPRRFELTGQQMTIGRRSRTRRVEPDIDLSDPPADPGVSARHALLSARPDSAWQLEDVGSTNGTVVGAGADPIAAKVPVVLADGDRIKIGAWTVLTVSVAPATLHAQTPPAQTPPTQSR